MIIVILLAWLLPGIIGRDLWKADEPYSFGLVSHIVTSGEVVVLDLAGEPFMEKPPLYYISAALCATLFSPWLQPHEAARMASVWYMLLTFLFIGLTARELFGNEYGIIAVLILAGSSGLQMTAHKLITDVSLLTGFSAALYGLAVSRRRPPLGGFWLGTGIGIGFLSKGLLAPGLIGITALALPLLFKPWRSRDYFSALLVAVVAALPWIVLWSLALYQRSPALFNEWFWNQNIGRYFGHAHEKTQIRYGYYLSLLPWFALPALPLAIWSLWKRRGAVFEELCIQLPLTAFLTMLLVLSASASVRDLYALPMLLPLALLAADGAGMLSKRTTTVLSRSSMFLFALPACLLWTGWAAMVTGHPVFLADLLYYSRPDYLPEISILLLVPAVVYSLAWLTWMFFSKPSVFQPIISWAVGMTLLWGLLMTLWLPWLDAGSGYKHVLTSLRDSLPSQYGTIASRGVGESERALLEYYAGIETKRVEIQPEQESDLLLIETGGPSQDPPPASEWRKLWEGKRHIDKKRDKETFVLYQRIKARPPGNDHTCIGRSPRQLP